MVKRPDVVLRNKSVKQRLLVGKALRKEKKRCVDCGIEVSTQRTERCIKCRSIHFSGRNHQSWSNTPKYHAVHKWIRKHKIYNGGCEECNRKLASEKIHLSNVDHRYKRDINEWRYLCPKCHRVEDIRNGLINMKKENHWAWGKGLSLSTKKKISDTMKSRGIKPMVLPNREQCIKNLFSKNKDIELIFQKP